MGLCLPGGKVDWTVGGEGRSPGWAVSLWYSLWWEQSEGCVWRSYPLRLQLSGQRLRHLRNHWVIRETLKHLKFLNVSRFNGFLFLLYKKKNSFFRHQSSFWQKHKGNLHFLKLVWYLCFIAVLSSGSRWRLISTLDQCIIRNWSTWSLIKCTPEPEAPERFSPGTIYDLIVIT